MAELPRVAMMGTGTFARPTLEALFAAPDIQVVGLVTQPDRDSGHQRGSTRQTGPSLKELAVAGHVPVFQPESVNTPDGVARLKSWLPDLLVVAAFGQILKNDVLETARWGGINVHGSLLPKYRGAAPIAHAILNGETRTGVTIIRMTTGLDAGDMLAQESLEIGPEETAGELEARMAPLGAKLARQVVEELWRAGGVSPRRIPQDPALVTKAPKLKKEDGLIDWSKPAQRVVRQIRAMQPWPTAYTFLHQPGKAPLRLTIQRAGVADRNSPGADAPGSPGQVFVGGALCVACGLGSVAIQELQPAGKKRMTAAEFLRGHQVQPGARFGPQTP